MGRPLRAAKANGQELIVVVDKLIRGGKSLAKCQTRGADEFRYTGSNFAIKLASCLAGDSAGPRFALRFMAISCVSTPVNPAAKA